MAVTENELLQLAESAFEQVAMLYAQVITINFALAAAVYYFLSEARLPMKIFAAMIYSVGMLMYVGFIGIQAKIWDAVTRALDAMPPENLSLPAKTINGLEDDWLIALTGVFLNVGLWILGIGSLFLLFFWKKDAHLAPAKPKAPAPPKPRPAFRLPNLRAAVRKDRA
jgi:hypothetical protein